jgi:CheY-like chemotaxis protein
MQIPTQLSGVHVLLVEDEPDIAELLSFVLRDAGADVIEVPSASEALHHLTHYSPSIIVCNIRLPDMNGGELLKTIRFKQADISQQIPAIAVTSYSREYSWTEAIKAGFDRFLLKPIEPDQLVSEILSLVRC